MRPQLLRLVRQRGVLTRAEALAHVAVHVLEDALADHCLARVFPGVYTLPESLGELHIQRRAALLYQPAAALSHTDALDAYGLHPAPSKQRERIHLTGGRASAALRDPRLMFHRKSSFGPDAVHYIGGDLRVVSLETAIVESWPLLDPCDQRTPTIVAVRERRTTAARLKAALTDTPRVAGRQQLDALLTLVAAGCHSPLEVWGHRRVFSSRRLPPSRMQVPLQLGNRTIYLDRYFEAAMTAVELDGAAYHGAPGQRERDLRRDAGVAAHGIQTLRFSHLRLHAEPDRVVEELRQILAIRMRQLYRGS